MVDALHRRGSRLFVANPADEADGRAHAQNAADAARPSSAAWGSMVLGRLPLPEPGLVVSGAYSRPYQSRGHGVVDVQPGLFGGRTGRDGFETDGGEHLWGGRTLP